MGNAYIYVSRSRAEIKDLILLLPNTTFYNQTDDTYQINDIYNNISGNFNSNQIIHIKHKSLESVVGKPMIDCASKTLGLAAACDSESLSTLNSGGRFKGIVSSESSLIGFGEVVDNQLQAIRDNMIDEINSGKDIITLDSGTNFTPISQTAKDLQITENKQYTLSDIARFLGISLSKLYISFGSNYQAAQQEQLNFFTDTLNPLLRKIELAFNAKLIPDSVADKYKIEFNRSTLPYYKDILSNYEKQMQLGILSVNDIRKIHNQKPIENGDEVVISTNLQYVSNPTVVANELENKKEVIEDSKKSKILKKK